MGAFFVSWVLLGLGMAAANPEALKAVSDSANTFSSNFFKTVSNAQTGNLICSPLSVDMVLSMLTFGAGGNTLAELRSGLHMPSDDSVTKTGYNSLINQLNNVKNVDLKLANKVFTAEKLPVKPDYLTTLKNVYNSDIQKVDFVKSADAANTINDWCKQQTNNRIKDIVQPNDLDGSTLMVLANAIYFKGDWAEKFNKDFTTNMTFHLNESATKQVPFMFKRFSCNTGDVKGMNARFVELPYKGNEFSMVIILPNQINGLGDLKQNLDKINMAEMLNSGRKREIELYLPKFEIESKIELNDILKSMGMGSMFTRNASFPLMSDLPVQVSKAIQKAFIKVDEEGSEAAAVTGAGITLMSLPLPAEQLKVDKPFIALITKLIRNDQTEINSGTVQNLLSLFHAIISEP